MNNPNTQNGGEPEKPKDIQALESVLFEHTAKEDLTARLRILVATLRDGKESEPHPKAYYTEIIERIFAEAGYVKVSDSPPLEPSHPVGEPLSAAAPNPSKDLKNFQAVSHPIPPEGCTCASFWTVRQTHKTDCPLASHPIGELEDIVERVYMAGYQAGKKSGLTMVIASGIVEPAAVKELQAREENIRKEAELDELKALRGVVYGISTDGTVAEVLQHIDAVIAMLEAKLQPKPIKEPQL